MKHTLTLKGEERFVEVRVVCDSAGGVAIWFVTNTASGMGLIKCGSVVIPFDNQISKDTDLYKMYNTNIHEKIAEQKKKEAMLQG